MFLNPEEPAEEKGEMRDSYWQAEEAAAQRDDRLRAMAEQERAQAGGSRMLTDAERAQMISHLCEHHGSIDWSLQRMPDSALMGFYGRTHKRGCHAS